MRDTRNILIVTLNKCYTRYLLCSIMCHHRIFNVESCICLHLYDCLDSFNKYGLPLPVLNNNVSWHNFILFGNRVLSMYGKTILEVHILLLQLVKCSMIPCY